MPWCDDCSKFWTPSSLTREGSCPTCGRPLPAAPGAGGAGAAPGGASADESIHTPWHFKLLLVALVVYLGYRAWEGIVWVIHHV